MRTTRFAFASLVSACLSAQAFAQLALTLPDPPARAQLIDQEAGTALRQAVAGDDGMSPEAIRELIRGLGDGPQRGTACPPGGWSIETNAVYTDAEFDPTGALVIGGGSGSEGILTKFSVSNVPASPTDWEWQRNLVADGHPVAYVHSVAVDFDGFIYAIGPTPDNTLRLIKLTPQGGVVWSWASLAWSSASTLVVGPEGIPIVSNTATVAQINPFIGFPEWVTEAGASDIAVDSRGDLYIANGSFLSKLSGASGTELWSEAIGFNAAGLRIDIEGDVFVAGQFDSSQFRVVEYSPTGAVRGTYTQPPTGNFVRFEDFVLDRNGNVIVVTVEEEGLFFEDDTRVTSIFSNNFGLFFIWDEIIDLGGDVPRQVAVDRRGNPYIAAGNDGAVGFEFSVFKLDPTLGGDPVWECVEDTPIGFTPIIRDLLVDGGGNVFTIYETNLFLGEITPGIKKIEQPVAIPKEFTACPRLVLEDRSLWAPGTGVLDSSFPFFDLPEPLEDLSLGFGGFFDIPFVGEFGAAAGVYLFTDFGAGFRAEMNGGTVDVDLPLDVTWTVPGKPFGPGPAFVDVAWSANPAARMTSCATPEFNAGITAFVDVEVGVGARAVAFDSELFNEELFHTEYSEPSDYILSLAQIWDDIGLPDPGEWQEFGDNIKVRLPKLTSQDCGTMAGVNSYMFSSSAEDCFFSGSFNITNKIVEQIVKRRCQQMGLDPDGAECAALQETIKLDQELSLSAGGGTLSLKLAALQLLIFVDLVAVQNLQFTVSPTVTYEIEDSDPEGVGIQTIGPQALADRLNFTMPPSGSVSITPTISATSSFHNETEINPIPGVEFKTLEVSGEAEAGGYGLFDFDECLLCFRERFDILPKIPIFDDSWGINFPEVTVVPFAVKGLSADMTDPVLVAASRESLPMVIYNQTSPTQSAFNIAASGTTKILLYGDRFPPKGGAMLAVILHQGGFVLLGNFGGIEGLETLNQNTVLIEFPNYLRLVPGVARIALFGSGTIDLPIELPVPRLDTVNPNLWAADPAFATVPVQVIDRGTPLGTDSFITRRDYFIKMRDELWPGSFATAGLAPADGFFPSFDFNQLPPFPAVLFDAMPLERFVQPVDSGIHNVRLAEQNYNRPALVNVQLCNPGPGGGISETKMLDIAAPKPVLTSISPREIEPGGELRPAQPAMDLDDPPDGTDDIPALPAETEFRMIVRGPVNVPTFDGYEEPKFGNFNADSVVRFDGFDLPTTFISSSELQAFVPDFLVQDAAVARVTVFTPSNGSYYFEELWADADMNGVRDDEPVFQDLIASGGESAPIFFPIRYRPPVIDQLNPPSTTAGNDGFDGIPKHNLAVIGENFRDGAVVLIDGQPRATQWVSRELLRVTLLPGDVSVIGSRLITVRNASPDEALSSPVQFNITPPVEPGVLPRVRP